MRGETDEAPSARGVERVDPAGCIRISDWDTAHFGFKIGVLNRLCGSDLSARRALRAAANRSVQCVYCSTAVDDDLTVLDDRFRRMDVKRHFAVTLPAGTSEWTSAGPEDFQALRIIAGAAFRPLTRFYKDSGFSVDKADELYRRWLDRGKDRDDIRVVAARAEDGVHGFSLVRIGEVATIELLAVAAPARGRGFGRRLVAESFGAARESGCTEIHVTTEQDNLPALALYQSMGFRERLRDATWHWWLDS